MSSGQAPERGISTTGPVGLDRTGTRRERVRAATVDEIKQTALTLMREQGTTDVRFADIARVMGLTAPALYRYFADRDELLTAMIVDAYADLGEALAAAQREVPAQDLGTRLLATASAYRGWALEHPQRFALIFGLPVAGYAAPEEGPTTEAARRAMANLEGLVGAAIARGQARPPIVAEVAASLAAVLAAKPPADPDEGDWGASPAGHAAPIPPATYQAMLHCWAGLHGFACLEAYGHLDWLGQPARDAMFVSLVRLAARAMGIPEPSR